MIRRLTYANVMSTLALFVALGGGAFAATKFVGGNGVVSLCVAANGTPKVLKAGQKCGKGKTRIAVNQTGPVGARGLQGPQGPPGSGASASYTAGAGLTLDGNVFSANLSQLQARIGACGSDQALQSVSQAGSSACVGLHAYSMHGSTFSTGDTATVNVPAGNWVVMANDTIVANSNATEDQECDIKQDGSLVASGLQTQLAGQDANVTAIGTTTTTLASTQIQAVCTADGSLITSSTGAWIVAFPVAALN